MKARVFMCLMLVGVFAGVGLAAVPPGGPVTTPLAPPPPRPPSAPTPNPWSAMANMPHDLYGGGAASDGRYLYVAGGYSFSSGVDVNSFYRYDPVANSWATLANLPNNDATMSSAAYGHDGKIYVFGGETVVTATVVNTTRIYDIASNTWSTGSPMPDIRAFMGSGYWNGSIYLVAGYNTGNVNPAFLQTWAYNVSTDTWNTSLPDVPAPAGFGGAGSGVVDGHLYVAGGRDANNNTINSVYGFDIAAGTWSTNAPLPAVLNVPGSAVVNGQLWIFGGGTPFAGGAAAFPTRNPAQAPTTAPDTQIYDPGADAWSTGPSLNTARSFISGANVNGAAVAAGGFDGGSTSVVTEVSQNSVCGSGVVNGGFERGDLTGWTVDGTNNPPVPSTGQASSGAFSVLLGNVSGAEPTGDSALYQTVTVPSGGGTLSFWTWTYTTDSISFDWQDAYVEDTSGNILETLFHQCNNDQAWVHRTFDLTEFAGNTIRIRFLVHQDGAGDDTAMYVDELRVLAAGNEDNGFANAGFESGNLAGWTVDGTNNAPAASSGQAHSGLSSVLLGNVSGPEPTGDSSLYQTVTVGPAGGTLSFYTWTYTVDSITFDWQDAYVEDTNGNILATIFHQCNNDQAWVHVTYDMSAFAGRTVRVRFLVHQDGFGDDTGMYVDDVLLIAPATVNVLIVSADCGAQPVTIQCDIASQHGIASVDTFADAAAATPTVSELDRYQQIVVFSDCGYADQNALGDNVADYTDAGGRVFALNFDWYGATQSLGGRWMSGGYSPFNDLAPVNFTNGSLGAFDATSGLMLGISGLNSFFRSTGTPAAGATVVASWNDATPLLAYHCLTAGATGYVGNFSGNFSGDWGRLIANAAFANLSGLLAVASGGGTICPGGSVALSGSGGATCHWEPTAGLDNANSCTPNASPAVTTVYTLTVSDGSGCTSSNAPTVTVTVDPLPTPTITPSGATTFCAGGSVTLDAGAGYAAYLWSPGGATTQTIVVGATGSYSVTVTDGNGCQGTSAPVVVVVNPLPTPTITPSGATTFCAGGSVTLDAGAGYAAYLWSPGGATTQTIAVSASGSYTVTVTDGNGCQGTSAPVVVTVNPNPAPLITVTHCLTPSTSGLSASTPANAGDTYAWTITGGTIDSGQGTDTISFTSGPAATLMTLNVVETTTAGCTGNAGESMQVNFNDVLPSNPFYNFICTIARHAITAGCGSGNFCPGNSVLRSQMAVFLLRGEHGSTYLPPACAGLFGDVACPSPFANWIEQVYNESIAAGCSSSPLLYCPNNAVTRASMAVFLLRAKNGPAYVPPACVGLFTDVACPGPFTNWIEALYNAGITGGCNTTPLMYCPNNPVTRAQMSVFLTVTFSLP